jgi:hypothetical protein
MHASTKFRLLSSLRLQSSYHGKRALAQSTTHNQQNGPAGKSKRATMLGFAAIGGLSLSAGLYYYHHHREDTPLLQSSNKVRDKSKAAQDEEDLTTILNWSGTHQVDVPTSKLWEPTTITEVEQIVKECESKGQPIRPVGSALSPNGIAFHSGGMMKMNKLDRIISINSYRNYSASRCTRA